MSNYTGDATGLNERTDAVVVDLPADLEDLNAESVNVFGRVLANFLKLLQSKAGFISLANTWAALQTFGVNPAFPAISPVDFSSLGSGWAQPVANLARYYKNALSEVVLEGALIATSGSPSGTPFTLPATYRPIGASVSGQTFICAREHSADLYRVQVTIDTSGGISPSLPSGDPAWANTDVLWLNGIRFRTT